MAKTASVKPLPREKLLEWRNKPELYMVERLGVTNIVDIPHQLRLLAALVDSCLDGMPVVVPSAHAMGKDFIVSGRASLWFVECFAPCKVIMTGPTDRQVREIMWSELEKAYNNRVIKDAFGRLITCKLDLAEDWFVLAFTTKETGSGEGKFQGHHSSRLMIIVSEAQKVEDKIYEQIHGLTTSGLILQVYLGNPTRTTGSFARMIKDTKHNRVIHFDAYESPNVIAGYEVVPGMVTKKWVDAHEESWNADKSGKDPRYRSRVRGLLPSSSINTVIGEDLYDKCIDRQIIETIKRGSIGVDPARFGDDEMVISAFLCGRLIEEKRLPKCDAVEGSGEVVIMQKKHFPNGQIAIVVDCDGLGGPFLDFAKKMASDTLDIVWVEFHGSCTDREIVGAEYHNHRAEAAFYAREQMEAGLIALDGSESCKEEAIEAGYFVSPRSGKLQIEDKEDIKERLGRSPNQWDSRTLGIWGFKFAPIMKARDMYSRQRSSSMVPGYNSAMGA